jgi:hypothetical protein
MDYLGIAMLGCFPTNSDDLYASFSSWGYLTTVPVSEHGWMNVFWKWMIKVF